MSTTLAVVTLVVALVAALAALALAGYAVRLATRAARTRTPSGEQIPADLEVLRDEVEALRADAGQTLRHFASVRYDAFGDMGGQMSWSLALLDDAGDGVVLTSIHGRSDSRTYAKNVAAWTCEQQLSPEETEAIAAARP